MSSKLTYASAGVDTTASDRFEEMIKERIAAAWPDAADEIGRFAGRWRVPKACEDFSLSVDGVGTKAHLAGLLDRLDGIGQDGVAMAVVDTYVNGDLPTAIGDFLVVEKLQPEHHIKIIEGIIDACRYAGNCRLLGGETAEEPDTFKHPWQFILGVFTVGFTTKAFAFEPVEPGQKVYGWRSYGPAANGFSLLRKTFGLIDRPSRARRRLERVWPDLGETLADALLRPTPIWINQMEIQRLNGVRFSGHAHITGGGLIGNIPRMLPPHCKVVINRSTWQRPPIFRLAQKVGNIPLDEMDHVFNQGIMVVSIVGSGSHEPDTPNAYLIGQVESRRNGEPAVELVGKYNDG